MKLNFVKPFLSFLPEVAAPTSKQNIRDRISWTAFALIIFLVCCQVPVFGIKPAKSSDPLYWMRMVLASNKGTLMELGISPLVTASLIIEVLVGIKFIEVDHNNKDERAMMEGAQKLLGLLITVVEAGAYVMSGMYGDVASIGIFMCVLIVGQLLVATLICQLLDELLQKEWGMGSGISLFIATNICDTIIWKSFSPMLITTGRGSEFEGAIIAFFHMLLSRADKGRALREALYRPQLPNMMNLLATVVVFLVVVYAQSFRVLLATTAANGMETPPYEVKLFYTSNMPIILQTALVSNFKFFSEILAKRFSSNLLVNLLGRWEERGYSTTGQMYPVGGLAKMMTAPDTIGQMLAEPLHAIFYVSFVLTTCALFSKMWIEINHTTPRDVARRLITEGRWLTMAKRTEDDMALKLNKFIPTAAAFGGLCIGALTIMADFLGAIGSGTGILLAVTMIYQYYEILKQEAPTMQLPFTKLK